MTKAYIHKYYTVPKRQYDWLNRHTKGWNNHTYHFFCHLLRSTITQVRQYRVWIPISSTLIKNHLWESDISLLQKQNLIQVKSHERKLNRTREYRINLGFLLDYFNQSPLKNLDDLSIRDYLNEDKVNLFNGERVDPFQKSILYDEHRNLEPKLIVDAIKSIRYTLYNQPAVLYHLRELRSEYEQYQHVDEAKFEHKLFDFILDLHCFESILNQAPILTKERDIYSYTPAYRIQSTGRIQAIGGGLQNCSKRMKMSAYSEIPDLEIFDIAASHANIILSQMANAGIECKWLVHYLSSPDTKYQYAEQIGIKYSTWKRCLYALLMGAPLRENTDNPVNSIRDYLTMDVPYDELEEAYQRFLLIVGPLKGPVNEWYDYLREDYIPRITRKVVGKAYIKNPAGKVKQLTGSLSKGQIAAFLVQGCETAFIHHLTILSNKYKYDPINNEHDALYVIGHISQQAISEAKAATGLRYLDVSEKTISF